MSDLLAHIIDGEQAPTAYSDMKQFLLDTPRGAYTTIAVEDDFCLINWETHVERLIKSLGALHTALDSLYYSTYYAYTKQQNSLESTLLDDLIRPSIVAALEYASQNINNCRSKMLTVILCPALPNDISPLHVHVAVAPWQPACNDSGAAWAVILGGPKQVPIGKDTQWVAVRTSLENRRPEGAAEILLASADGRLLEGLVTNLFIVREDTSGSKVLETAGMDTGVVWGTMRVLVMQACEELGVQVVERAPDAAERETWTEAFLTNSLRCIQPLARIACGQENIWGFPAWEQEFPIGAPGPLTLQIRQRVLELLPKTDFRVK